jgi:hypothetical protein
MRALIDSDRVIGVAKGDIAGDIEIPKEFDGVPVGRLFVSGGRVIDAGERTTFFIDGHGRKHIEQGDASWPEVKCVWDDALKLSETGKWSVDKNADAKNIARAAAGA